LSLRIYRISLFNPTIRLSKQEFLNPFSSIIFKILEKPC
jgi:hypothetical protein